MCVLVLRTVMRLVSVCIFFFKQKTAYEMRISDWSSDVCSSDLNVLTEAQRRDYFRNGYLSLPNYVPETWLKKLHDATSDLLERSRKIEQSDATYVLEDGHSQDNPRLHRVTSPQDHHPAFWDFICSDVMTNLVADGRPRC